MKKIIKTFLAGTAFAVSAASVLTLSGCCLPRFLPSVSTHNTTQTITTAAQDEQPQTTQSLQTETETNTEITTKTEIETVNETETALETETIMEPQAPVYGPPEWFDISQEEELNPTVYGPPAINGSEAEIENDFSVEDEIMEDVYGPPDAFNPEDEVMVDVYGPPDAFNPEDEVMEDVYGPPEWFD